MVYIKLVKPLLNVRPPGLGWPRVTFRAFASIHTGAMNKEDNNCSKRGGVEVDLRMPLCRSVDIEGLSIPQLHKCLESRKFSVYDLTACYLERIRRVNRVLKAVIEVNPDALDIAMMMDREREQRRNHGLLHGIPFLVKDTMGTKDKMRTTAGSSVLVGTVVPEDAHVVSLLRRAGAVLLGHANLSEWASMRSTYYSEGYSSRGGQCRNPYNLAEHPGGSSCGSAVAVASNMCAFSLGTETDGSIMVPADRNGIVGIKPTVGLTCGKGVIPESHSLDSVGTFGRTVLDAAIALDGIVDSPTGARLDIRSFPTAPFVSFVSGKEALRGAQFGLPWKGVWEKVKQKETARKQYQIFGQVIERIRGAGANVIEYTDFPSAEEIIPPGGWDWDYPTKQGHPEQSQFTVVKTEFYNDLKTYLSNLAANPNNIRSLDDVVKYNATHAEKEGGRPGVHPAWPSGQDSFEMSLETGGVMDETYHHALAYIRRKSREEGIDAALSRGDGRQLDGLLVPLQADSGVGCQVAAKAGYPMITIPVGIATGENEIPFGIGIIQTAWREDKLIKYGSAIEDLLALKLKPTFMNIDADNYMYIGAPPES
ncbi:amidase [Blastomyces gilchristii SLH14081]|uniref:Amidase n=1 Tax=Blastomyces gilchristii (strain SLH14081) TaxID=559298 RepID=A0A179UCT3_BLAGS|nr:amidase [Blastomyces gilchristii SLH14081]OAT05815.1 amidase [Blastomyces gilchristii SLH14081]